MISLDLYFVSRFQKAQEEIENHLKTAEMLSLKGDTRGQKEQIVNELLKVHTRFQARVTEYQVLLSMTIKFFKNLSQVSHKTSPPPSGLSELFCIFTDFCVHLFLFHSFNSFLFTNFLTL